MKEEILKGAKSIKDLDDLDGKRVLLRLDLNVPMTDSRIDNDYRIKKSIPTIKFLKDRGAKIIIISHLWGDGSKTLEPVYQQLSKGMELTFIKSGVSQEAKIFVSKMKNGKIVLLENLRLEEGEVENDMSFAVRLSELADIYVNDAFATSHRDHASIVSLPQLLPSYYGLLFEKEVENLSTALNPPKPFLFILGGAKFETKIPLIIKYLDRADYVYIAGALANDFFKIKGFEIGRSSFSGKDYNLEKYLDRENLILPRDVTVQNKDGIYVKRPDEVVKEDKILDIGVEALSDIRDLISKSKFILWNGPLGNYEEGFRDGTIDLAKAVAKSSAYSIVGGGDTFAVISKLHLEEEFDFISTAGGALLEFLYSGTLPGIEALKQD
jgi:phosphoglycerate kinase